MLEKDILALQSNKQELIQMVEAVVKIQDNQVVGLEEAVVWVLQERPTLVAVAVALLLPNSALHI